MKAVAKVLDESWLQMYLRVLEAPEQTETGELRSRGALYLFTEVNVGEKFTIAKNYHVQFLIHPNWISDPKGYCHALSSLSLKNACFKEAVINVLLPHDVVLG